MDLTTRARIALALVVGMAAMPSLASGQAPAVEPPRADPAPPPPPSGSPGAMAGAAAPRAVPRLAQLPLPASPGGAGGAGDLERRIRVDSRGRLTLHMDDLDIRRALELLSRQGGLNIMVAPGVAGQVTANLEGVTVDEALAAILRLTNLTARREGGLIFVYSPQELKALAYRDQPVETRLFRLNYVRAMDVMGIVSELLSPDGTITATPPAREGINESPSFNSTGGSGSGGSGGGGGAVAPSTPGGGNAGGNISGPGGTGGYSMSGGDLVIVRDYKGNLATIEAVIHELDVAPIQVLIEAIIITINLQQNQALGVNYALVDNHGQRLGTIGSPLNMSVPSAAPAANLLTNPFTQTSQMGGFASTATGISYGFVTKNLSGFVNALETLGEVRVLASPRILVLNKQKAEIQLGQRIGYRTLTQNFTSTTQQIQFLNTGTLLRLRPFVSTDGMVRMEIHPERSTGSAPAPEFVPTQSTAEMTSNVMVPDGVTLVIGGLMEDERDFNQEGLPGLNRLPILGAAFGERTKGLGKRELVVLLTPHIWRPNIPPVPPPHGGIAPLMNGPVPIPVASTPGTAPATSPARATVPPATSPAPVASPAPAEAPRPGGRHVVREGEDLWSIAKLRYGSGRYYQALWAANRDRVASPEAIAPGTELRLPAAAELACAPAPTSPTASPAPGPAAAASAGPTVSASREVRPMLDPGLRRAGFESEPETPPAPRPRAAEAPRAPADDGDAYPIHVVARFESLRSIARDRLGDARRASEILALNRDTLRSSDRPVPGQHLRLPKDAAPLRRGR